jgi:hypothetical protein
MRGTLTLPMALRGALSLSPLALGGQAGAQEQSFFFVVGNEVNPDQPQTSIEVWATFDPVYHAFFRGAFTLSTEVDPGRFLDQRFPEPFYGEEGYVPPGGDSVTGIWAEQFVWVGYEGNTSNPVHIWSCSWTTDDFTPRRLQLDLLATQFWVYLDPLGQGLQVEFVPDALGYINVIPAPPAGAALVFGTAALASRRRRGRGIMAGCRGAVSR